MPLIKRLISVGDSRAVTIPKSYLQFHEKKNGKKISKVGMEINGKIVIWPILQELE